MKSTYFHTRMLIMSSLVVGAALAAVIALGWSRILQIEATALDERMCYEARRIVERPGLARQGDLYADLLSKLQLTSTEQLMMRVEGDNLLRDGLAERWPLDLAVNGLRWLPARFESGDVSRQMANCQLASFAYHGAEWHAAATTVDERRGIIAANVTARSRVWRQELGRSLFIFVPLALGLTALGSWVLATLTMRPVNRLREAMRGMTGSSLDQRLPKHREDREFQELIDAYNNMLARLETSFHQASRFSADAAHELKTPLTILQGHIEQAMHNADQQAQQRLLGGLLEEVGRLSVITRKLLLLSQADAGHLNLQQRHLDLSALLEDVLHDAPLLLEQQQLQCEIAPRLYVMGDAQLLTQVFNNLLSNAVRHGQPQGWIRITANQSGDNVNVVFANACAAVSEAKRQRFFDRFFRGEHATAQHPQGSGLGLSLAREIARAHGGDLLLDSTSLEVVQLRLQLPAAAPP